jgi:hypothetical protein
VDDRERGEPLVLEYRVIQSGTSVVEIQAPMRSSRSSQSSRASRSPWHRWASMD